MEEEMDIVTFTDEDGNEYDLAVLTYFEHEEDTYALLFDPASTEEEEAEVEIFIMKAVGEGDNMTFVSADDDKMDALSALAEEILDEMQQEEDCECGCGCEKEDCEHEHSHDCDCGCEK